MLHNFHYYIGITALVYALLLLILYCAHENQHEVLAEGAGIHWIRGKCSTWKGSPLLSFEKQKKF